MKTWKIVLTVVVSALALSSAYAQTQPSPVPAAATALATRYLRAIERSWVMPPAPNGESDCVMLGRDRSGSGDWRVLVLTGAARPRVAWDSQRLQLGGYFTGTSAETVTLKNDEHEGYLIAIKGCARRRCYDGAFGYAVYVGTLKRAFVARVTTRLSNRNVADYSVAYDPQAGVPAEYRTVLNRMICAEPGISEPGKLPFTCPGR